MKAIVRFLAIFTLICAGTAFAKPALAQQTGKKATPPARSNGPLAGFGSNSKEPVQIEAARLQIFDREQRAVYSGDVVTVQGKSTLRCSRLTIFYDNKKDNSATPQPAADNGPQAAGNSIRKMICDGPVSVTSCTQTATGDHGEYESATDLVILTGNVVLTDGPNIQRGDKLVYNLKDGTATVTALGRVGGTFKPESDAKKPSGCS